MESLVKYSSLSASIVIIRRHPVHEYELLLMRRANNTYTGGAFAFPGGKVESQDLLESWQHYFAADAQEAPKFHDFNKRVAAIRETFEEC